MYGYLAGGIVGDAGSSNSMTKCHKDREGDRCNDHSKKTRLSGLPTEVDSL